MLKAMVVAAAFAGILAVPSGAEAQALFYLPPGTPGCEETEHYSDGPREGTRRTCGVEGTAACSEDHWYEYAFPQPDREGAEQWCEAGGQDTRDLDPGDPPCGVAGDDGGSLAFVGCYQPNGNWNGCRRETGYRSDGKRYVVYRCGDRHTDLVRVSCADGPYPGVTVRDPTNGWTCRIQVLVR